MSKEVDERVVSMQFDNKHFERNVQTTMSTLDKLKEKLHLPGAAKGLQEVDAAAKRVDLSSMGKAAETVGLKFNAMYTIADQALRNITNSAMAAGKRIVSALTIDPVKTGFKEYELKMDSVKTIMASTGESIETVNKYLEELNEYSDQTIYSFSDMTQNIGKFTNAGVELKDAVMAIKGISNEAAVSGANANEASRAMYNFAQALSAGYVKLIDWKSIELANMGTKEFKEQLIETAVELGTVVKVGDKYQTTTTDMNGNISELFTSTSAFNESLSAQWMTTEVLVETLKDYADETTDIGKKAFAAAQDVTKLSQMFDVLKETAQSGWARTWEILFGDLEQAKALFTPLTEFFSKIITGMNDARNAVLESALGRSFKAMIEPIKGLSKAVDTISEPIKEITKTLEDYNKVVKEVIKGDWGNTDKRWKALADAGYDWATVQNMVNEELGCSVRHATDFAIGQSTATKATEKAIEADSAYIAMLSKKSDEELRALGLNKEQIEAVKQIRKEADKLGMTVEEFIDNIDKIDGRWVVLEGFKNIGKALGKVFKTVSQAWKEIFPPKSTEEKANALYDLLAAFHKFTKSLTMSDRTADNLKRTLKGLFAVLDIITTITGGAFKMAFKIASSILGAFNIDILEFTAIIGDGLVFIRDFVDGLFDFGGIVKKVVPWLKKVATEFSEWVKGLKEADNIPKYIIQGLVNGLTSGVKTVVDIVFNLGKKILETVKGVLGIHSPSREFFEIGKNIIQGLYNGIKDGLSLVWDIIQTVGTKCIEWMKSLDIGTIIAGGIAIGMVTSIFKIADAVQSFGNAFDGLGDMFEGLGDMFEDFGNSVRDIGKGIKQNLQAKAMLSVAIALGILVASIVVLTKIDTDDLWGAIGALAALAGIMVAISFAASKMSTIDGLGTQIGGLLAIAGAMLMLSIVMNKLASIKGEDIPKVIGLLSAMILGVVAVVKYAGAALKADGAQYAKKLGSMLLKISIALLILVGVIKLIDMLEPSAIGKGLAVLSLFGIFCTALIAVSKLAGEHASKAGSMILKISIALGIMVLVMKMIGGMDRGVIEKGFGVLTLFGSFCAAMIAISILAGRNATKAGSMLLMISFALAIVVGVMFMIGQLSDSAITKGLAVIETFGIFCAALVAVSKLAGEHAARAGSMMLMISGALLILTGIMFLMSLMNPRDLARGLAAIVVLELCCAGLIAITKIAKSSKQMQKTLLILLGAIATLSLIVVALSFIEPTRLLAATAAISILSGVFAGLIAATKLAKNTAHMRKTLMTLLGTVAVLAAILAALSLLNPQSALTSAVALSTLLTSFATSIAILGAAGKVSASVHKQILPMLAVTAGLAAILGILSALDCEPSMETAAALSTMLIGFSAALAILSYVGPVASGATKAIGPLIAVVTAMGAFVVAVGALNDLLDGKISDFLENGIEVLTLLGQAIGGFVGGIVGGFISGASSGLPELGKHLSEFMINLEPFINGVNNIGMDAMGKIGILSAVILALTAVDLIQGIAKFLQFGSSFGELGLELTKFMVNALPFINGLKLVDSKAVDSANAIAEMILSLSGSQLMQCVTDWLGGETDMAEFGKQLKAFGEAAVDFSSVVSGNIDSEAVNAAANAGKMIASMVDTIPGTGGVVQFFTGEKDFRTFSNNLIPFGEAMRDFSTIVSGNIDSEAVNAAANAGKMIASMVDTIPESGGVVQFFTGEKDFRVFTNNLTPFGQAIKDFSAIITADGGIDSDAIEAAANAGKMIASMADTIPNSGGVVGFICGENDLDTFADMFPSFGKGLAKFSKAITEEGGIDIASMEAATKAGGALAEMANKIPNSGGLLGLFCGNNDLDEFAEQFPAFGEGVAAFSNAVKGQIFPSEIEAAVEAGGLLAELTKKIPDSGSFFGFFGNDDLEHFGEQIKPFGQGIMNFATAVKGITSGDALAACTVGTRIVELSKVVKDNADSINIVHGWNISVFNLKMLAFAEATKNFVNATTGLDASGIENARAACTSLAMLADSIANRAGVKTIGDGGINLTGFGGYITDFAKATKMFAEQSASINIDAVQNGVAAAEKVSRLVDIMPGGSVIDKLISGKSNLSSFGNQLLEFGDSLKQFDDNVSDIDVNYLTSIVEGIKNISKLLGEVGDSGVKGLSDAFVEGCPKVTKAVSLMLSNTIQLIKDSMKPFSKVGESIVDMFALGMITGKEDVTKASKDIIKSMTDTFDTETIYDTFYDIGAYVADGLADGISDSAYKATDAATAMAAAAEKAIRGALKINSPSKVFRSIGYSIPEGLSMGVDKLSYMVTNSSVSMGESAINGVKNSISRITDAINGDIDSQPTIRPVMDLSDVTSGVGTLNGMLGGMTPSVDVMANIRSIGSMMRVGQNGGNDDIISAIDDLRKSLGNISGDTYSINGITYDDGSNITEAVKSLVHAAKIERRI